MLSPNIISPQNPRQRWLKRKKDTAKGDKKKKRHKRAKKQRIKIDRTEYSKVDKNTLPLDAEHKGYRNVSSLE